MNWLREWRERREAIDYIIREIQESGLENVRLCDERGPKLSKLIQQGYLQKTPRGRIVSDRGYAVLGQPRDSNGQQSFL